MSHSETSHWWIRSKVAADCFNNIAHLICEKYIKWRGFHCCLYCLHSDINVCMCIMIIIIIIIFNYKLLVPSSPRIKIYWKSTMTPPASVWPRVSAGNDFKSCDLKHIVVLRHESDNQINSSDLLRLIRVKSEGNCVWQEQREKKKCFGSSGAVNQVLSTFFRSWNEYKIPSSTSVMTSLLTFFTIIKLSRRNRRAQLSSPALGCRFVSTRKLSLQKRQ